MWFQGFRSASLSGSLCSLKFFLSPVSIHHGVGSFSDSISLSLCPPPLSLFAWSLVRPVVSSGLATSYYSFPDTLLPSASTFCVPSAPMGSILVLASIYQNLKRIHNTMSFAHCHFSHSTRVRDGFGFIIVADATTSGVQAMLRYCLLKGSLLLLGYLC